ncbi:hypothetical protein XELAEV_18021189mg [Xenopus laevis]|uniref:Uncharacterized protein n=1 Tax=Xenopus laevis TaxID=8355 RepID=A0A974DAW9_XENLA|nr:hypothetical protein XELAEV_18021189mg [Xenopus laevis]
MMYGINNIKWSFSAHASAKECLNYIENFNGRQLGSLIAHKRFLGSVANQISLGQTNMMLKICSDRLCNLHITKMLIKQLNHQAFLCFTYLKAQNFIFF